MSICICGAKHRNGEPRCRGLKIDPTTHAMTCGRALELLACIRANVEDTGTDEGDVDGLQIDVEGLILDLRALGWRVDPPRKAPAPVTPSAADVASASEEGEDPLLASARASGVRTATGLQRKLGVDHATARRLLDAIQGEEAARA